MHAVVPNKEVENSEGKWDGSGRAAEVGELEERATEKNKRKRKDGERKGFLVNEFDLG